MGRDWGKAPTVGVPPGNLGTIPPQVGPHPLHFQGGQADMVAVTPGGPGLIAVGYLDPDIVATAWTSADGLTWDLIADFPAPEGSLAAAVAAGAAGIVAVGSDGPDAGAWHSADGAHWIQAPAQTSLTASPQVRMTSAVATEDRFLAAGYIGSISGPITAVFWHSPDGDTWTRVPDESSLAGAQVLALSVGPSASGAGASPRFIAVGARGDAQRPAAAAAWSSADGRTWQAIELEDAGDTALYAVAAGPAGLVAVGNDANSLTGVAWTSTDGATWVRSPDDASLGNGGSRIELRAVTWAGTQFVAGGHRNFGTQRGTAVLWTSADGRAWVRAPETPALGGGKLFGLAAGPTRVVAVGSFGAPDLYVPIVWISPPAT